MKSLVLKIIHFYQTRTPFLLSWHSSCRFQPTCSDYTYQAIKRYGIMRGSWLGFKRLCRCHPFHQPGWDPIPKLIKK